MAYVGAALAALVAATVLGAALGSVYVVRSLVVTNANEKTHLLAAGVSGAMNCGALLVLVLVPLALGLVYFRRRRCRLSQGPTA